MFKLKLVSGLEKVFCDETIDSIKPLQKLSVLKGERFSFQIALELTSKDGERYSRKFSLALSGALKPYATVRRVVSIPAYHPYRGRGDDDLLRKGPALIPDLLAPLQFRGDILLSHDLPSALWVEVDVPKDCDVVGKTTLRVDMKSIRETPTDSDYEASAELEIEILDAVLPEQKLLFTQWFHSDCLAEYYQCEKWSDEHFRIIANFMRTARRNGINMIFTPLLTPPLDNAYDTRDLQLAEITKTEEGYTFSWDTLGKWIDLCNEIGFEYFEIGHLFTQTGAVYATKASGMVNGEYVRLFPATTSSVDPEYTKFLREMLTSFLAYMKNRGDDRRCYFHISDEPPTHHIETYRKAKESIADLLEGYPIMDALSDYAFYRQGIVQKPVVKIDHWEEFVEQGALDGLWIYYCSSPRSGYSNRFLSMSLARCRSLFLVLYKYNIEGFLHWGYNFYNNAGSADRINPYLDTSSGGRFQSGDAFSVYPAENGEAYETNRICAFMEGLQDLRALQLCETLYSRETVLGTVEEIVGPIHAETYLNTAQQVHELREAINAMIKEKLA